MPKPLRSNVEKYQTGSTAIASTRIVDDCRPVPIPDLSPVHMQPKLTVNAPGDMYEKEADLAVAHIMRMPEPRAQRPCACGGGCPACCGKFNQPGPIKTLVQAKRVRQAATGVPEAPPIVHEVIRSPGQPLAGSTRAFFEPRFGHDFSKVRVHTDAKASEAAQAVRAKAFTVGQDTVFGQGQYFPETERGQQLLAHELTHVVQQTGGRKMLQRAETDTVPGCTALVDTESDVDARVNASLAAARTSAGTPPAGTAVARGVEIDLGRNVQTGRSAIEVWASTLPSTKVSLPTQGATKYAGVTYRLWSQPLFPILNPTMKINGICVGSDKLGHFFQQGAAFRRSASSSGRAAAEEESERSEGGGFGLVTTGIFSNADQEANRQGGGFYRDLVASPTMTFAISRYISSRWSEVDNPNFYESSVGRQVWANLLAGTWTGQSWAGPPRLQDALSVTLVTSGAVTGTFSIVLAGTVAGVVPPPVGTIRGVITYNTTRVRGTGILGDTNYTPISGIHIDFDWTLGTESGKGFLDSSGERRLTGRWGGGTSNTDRGAWDITHT